MAGDGTGDAMADKVLSVEIYAHKIIELVQIRRRVRRRVLGDKRASGDVDLDVVVDELG